MSDKASKPKKAKKSAKSQPSVLGSLPSTRPERLGSRGVAAGDSTPRASAPKPPAKPRAKPKSKPASTRPTAASTAAAAEKRAAAEKAAARRAAAGTSDQAPPPPPRDERAKSGPPSGPELVTTAIQAAGEIAQIGLTVGGQVLKRAVRRLPRP